MNFIEAIEQYPMIKRTGWNEKGMFVFKQIPSEVPISVVPKMQSLPKEVKEEFERRYNVASDYGAMTMQSNNPLLTIRYCNQLAIVNMYNTINGWVPSVSDVLSNDWTEYIPE
jgi:hypothetical protein